MRQIGDQIGSLEKYRQARKQRPRTVTASNNFFISLTLGHLLW